MLQIHFVFDHHCHSLRGLREQFSIFITLRLGRIEHDQHQIRIGQGFHGFPDPDALSFVEGAPDSGRVNQLDRNAADGNCLGHKITRRAWSCGHDGALMLDQPVK